MKKLLSLILTAAAVFSLASCGGMEEEFLDNSYVYISDGSGNSSATVTDDKIYNPYTLWVTLSTAKTDFDGTVEVYYEAVPDGLVEGVDYTIKAESKSPLKFTPGNYVVPLRIVWEYKTPNKGTLTIRLKEGKPYYLQMGYPGMSPATNKSTFVFTK